MTTGPAETHPGALASASPPARAVGRGRLGVALFLFVATLIGVGAQAVFAVHRVSAFEGRRADLAAIRTDPAALVLDVTDARSPALQSFQRVVAREGRRFDIVFGSDISDADRSTVTLATNAAFLPATNTSTASSADYLVLIGDVPPARRSGFETVSQVGDAWLGRRTE